MAGGLLHHRTLFDRYHPGYFGKRGMRYFNKRHNHYHCPTINVDKLWTLLSEHQRTLYRNKEYEEGSKVAVIDVTQFGIFKVLGGGVLPNRPLIVKAKFFTRQAEEKIKDVGGVCVLIA